MLIANDECSSSPCLNGGTCLEENPGTFKCVCADNFYGNRCKKGK